VLTLSSCVIRCTPFPQEYVRDLRDQVLGTGRIDPTGCPELPF
jgi:hypothetical protein